MDIYEQERRDKHSPHPFAPGKDHTCEDQKELRCGKCGESYHNSPHSFFKCCDTVLCDSCAWDANGECPECGDDMKEVYDAD